LHLNFKLISSRPLLLPIERVELQQFSSVLRLINSASSALRLRSLCFRST
jgi:hypothetical protein